MVGFDPGKFEFGCVPVGGAFVVLPGIGAVLFPGMVELVLPGGTAAGAVPALGAVVPGVCPAFEGEVEVGCPVLADPVGGAVVAPRCATAQVAASIRMVVTAKFLANIGSPRDELCSIPIFKVRDGAPNPA